MKIEVRLTEKCDAYIIKNLYPLYLYDLSAHYERLPNVHGVYEENEDVKSLQEQYGIQHIWWEKPDVLFPYLILSEGTPVGFILIATPPYCNKGIDFFVNEFFLIQSLRGKGIAESAANIVFDQYKGKWELFTNPLEKNIAGQKFWRKCLSNYTKGAFTEINGETFNGYQTIFRFDNRHSN